MIPTNARQHATKRIPPSLLAGGFAVGCGYGGIYALLAAIQDAHHLPTWGLGLLTGTTFGASLVAQIAVSPVVDRGHQRSVLMGSLGGAAIGMLWLTIATQLWQFALARLIFGLGAGAFLNAQRSVIARGKRPDIAAQLGLAISIQVAGFVLGPPLIALMANALGLRWPFAILAVVLVGPIPAIWRTAAFEAPGSRPPGLWTSLETLMKIPGIRIGVILNGSLYFALGAFDTLWARFLTDRGATTTLVGVSLALTALPTVGLTARGGRLADAKGHVRVGVVGVAVSGMIVGVYGVVGGLVTVIVLAILQTVVQSASRPAIVALGANAAPNALTASGQGTLGAAGAGGAALASLIAAPLYSSIGQPGAWMAVGAVQVAGAALAGLVALQSRRVPSG